MNKTEYIGKLNALYVGDKNCLEELITAYDEKEDEIERLNKEIEDYQKELEKADSITQSCIFEGKEEATKNIRVCFNELERLNNIINRTTKYVESLSSSGRGCDIYEDIKQEILKELKGSDKE